MPKMFRIPKLKKNKKLAILLAGNGTIFISKKRNNTTHRITIQLK
jgi:exosome complex RNA-binding protein Rrp4